MIRYLFKRDTLLATLLVFVVMGLLALIPLNTHVLDPIKLALQDFDYNDLAYSRMGKNKNTFTDTSLVIVNIGEAERGEIAAIISRVQSEQPLATGVDVLFEQPRTVADDSLLISLAATAPNLVMVYKLDSLEKKGRPVGFLYAGSKAKGYSNFVGEEGGVIRYYLPQVKQDAVTYTSFAAAVVQKAAPEKYNRLLQRGNLTETINYTRNNENFMVVDGRALLAGSETVSLRNKIVLIGYVPAKSTDVEDKHFTPMNANSFGKSVPDMHGVMVHANIIQMILNENYVSKMPTWLTWVIAALLGWIHMAFFLSYFVEKHLWFHLAAKVAQVVSAVFFMYLGLLVFYQFDYKINLTPSFLAIILAVDVLYFYEAICHWLHKKFGYKHVFHHH
jgi:CHASE2 domain-containing sensor protein